MSVCPAIEILEETLAGRADDAVRSHLESCAKCRKRLEHIRANNAVLGQLGNIAPTRLAAAMMGPAPDVTPRTDMVPGYEILSELSRGGQGVVYQAIQKSTKRKVAIKVMKEGPFAGPRDRARFEREIQILGQLNHSNIVTILDSGEAHGNFYLVTRYISGQSLDAHIAPAEEGRSGSRSKAPPTVPETLQLFAKICEAVNAAHLRGVIHRDLKPGNIRIDSNGEPHILDFGLAKLAVGHVTDESHPRLMSQTGQFMGSLPWASPEQAEGALEKIDLRTDVYSLGVVLFQMLTGKFPYEVGGNMRDVTDNILNVEPANPRALRKHIDDEVETIVLKCLAKERERRYQSAGDLGRDIRRYLAGEPIEARRDSTFYLLKKTLRRYRAPVAVAATMMALVLVSTIVLFAMYREQSRARAQAVAAEQEKEGERKKAVAAREEAEQARQLAERAKQTAEERAEALRRRNYVNLIGLARHAYETANFIRLPELLSQCDADLRGWEWQYLHWLSDLDRRRLAGHAGGVTAAAFSPDGRWIASGGADRTVKLWNAETRRLQHTFDTGHADAVLTVAFSPDGRRLVSGGADRTLKLWDVETGRLLHTFSGHTGEVTAATFSPDGGRIASGSADRTVKIWEVASGRELTVFRGHLAAVRTVAFSPDGRRLVSAGLDRTVRVWDADDGRERLALQRHTNAVSAAAFSPDGRRLLSAGYDRLVLWDADSGRELRSFRDIATTSAVFSPDGRRILTGNINKTLRLWDADSGQELRFFRGHTGRVTAAAFSPDGRRFVSASDDATLLLWTAEENWGERTIKGHTSAVKAAVFSPDSRYLLSGGGDQTLKLWDAQSDRELRSFQNGQSWIGFSSDGRRILLANQEGPFQLYDTETRQSLHTFAGHERMATVAAFSPDGRRIASGGLSTTLKMWDAETERELYAIEGYGGARLRLYFSPNGRHVLAVGHENVGYLLDAESGQQLRRFTGHAERVVAAAFSSDGRRIASAGEDQTLRLWDADTGRELRKFVGHVDAVTAVAFSPDGRRIASGGSDQTLKLWDAETGDELLSLPCRQWVDAIAFGTNTLVAGCRDGMLLFWDNQEVAPEISEARFIAAEARRVLEALLAKRGAWAEVVCALNNDAALAAPVRAEVLRLAQPAENDAYLLNLRAWEAIKTPDRSNEVYQLAARWAQAAVRAAPDDADICNTLGVAQFRLQQYAEALETLTRSANLHAARGDDLRPEDASFLAMALYRLGRSAEAQTKLQQLQAVFPQLNPALRNETQGFLREAETLLNAQPDAPAPKTSGPSTP